MLICGRLPLSVCSPAVFFNLWEEEEWHQMNTVIDSCLAKRDQLPETAGGERFPLALQRESTFKLWRLLTDREKPALIYSDPVKITPPKEHILGLLNPYSHGPWYCPGTVSRRDLR